MNMLRAVLLAVLLALLASLARSNPPPAPSRGELLRARTMAVARGKHSTMLIRELREEIISTDSEIERRVKKVVRLLSGVQDSTGSRTRIINLKQEIGVGLRKSIDFYLDQRRKMREQLYRGSAGASEEDLEKGLEIVGDRIDTRVDQILELTETLTRDQGYAKYEHHYRDSGRWRGNRDSEELSDKWLANRHQTQRSEQLREHVTDELEAAVTALERRNNYLESHLPAMSKEQRRVAEDEIAGNEENIEKRSDQVETAVMGTKKPQRKVGLNEVAPLERMINSLVGEIRENYQKLIGLRNEIDVERGRVQQLAAQIRLIDDALAETPEPEPEATPAVVTP